MADTLAANLAGMGCYELTESRSAGVVAMRFQQRAGGEESLAILIL